MYYKCNQCNEYYELDPKSKIIDIAGISYNLPFINDRSSEENLNSFYAIVLEKIQKKNEINFDEFEIYISDEYISLCPKCRHDNNIFYSVSIADGFYNYVNSYLGVYINSISIKYLHNDLRSLDQKYSDIYEHIVTRLPYKLRYEKRKITKLLKIRDQIPCIGGKGGDIEFLNWFTNNIINNTFSIIFSACVVFGSNKIKSKLKNKNIKKLIKKKIIKESVNWDDITLDELVENFTIPKDYKGSKEELIEEIVYEKAIQYKEKIIEKIRNT